MDSNQENNMLALTQEEMQMAAALDALSATGLACRDMKNNFTKVVLSARCVQEFKRALTPAVMQPIMALQGSPLGFRTDKDKEGGYPEAVVKEVIIAAAMLGLMPVGNQFNIIGARFYITKEGFMFLLGNIAGLRYDVDLAVPKQSNGGAVVHAHIVWSLHGGEEQCMDAEIPVRVNNGMGADAVLGKAMRKACCRLYNKLTNSTLSDGDVTEDAPMKDVTPRWSGEVVRERMAAAAPAKVGMAAAVPPAPAVAAVPVVDAEAVPSPLPAAVRLPDEDGIPGVAPDEEEQQAAALEWMRSTMADSGKSWRDVYRAMEERGWQHPVYGAPKEEMGAFSLWVFRDRAAREQLQQHGFVLSM